MAKYVDRWPHSQALFSNFSMLHGLAKDSSFLTVYRCEPEGWRGY